MMHMEHDISISCMEVEDHAILDAEDHAILDAEDAVKGTDEQHQL